MISIRRTLSDLEKFHQERALAIECYSSAIRNMAHYTVELDSSISEPQRQFLNELAAAVASGSLKTLEDSRATLRALLREYRDRAAEYLNRLREELSGTARALEEILDSLAQTDGDGEAKLRRSLDRLRELAASPAGTAVRQVLLSTSAAIQDSVEEMRKQHQLAISQFQVEIRMLHKRIDALEAASAIDQVTKLFSRDEIEQRIRGADRPYCLLLAQVRGFRLAEVHFNTEVVAELAAAFVKRLKNALPPTATIARWAHEQFVIFSELPKADAMTLAKFISEHLSGAYSCIQAGKTVRPTIQLSVGVVDSAGLTPDRMLDRIVEFLPDGGEVTSARADPRR